MSGGLPLGTWVLMVLSTLPGLVLVVAAYRVHGGARVRGAGNRGERGPEAPHARPDRGRSRG